MTKPQMTRTAAGSGIAVFADVFASLGWHHGDDYAFPDVHLRVIHMSQPGLRGLPACPLTRLR